MKIEDIIKIIWHRKFYILLPALIVPFVTIIAVSMMVREYETESLVFINESVFRHPTLLEFGIKIELEERLPSIKKIMKSDESLFFILGEKKPEVLTAEYLESLSEKKNRIVIELKGPGVARLSYSGTNPSVVKSVVERAIERFIQYSLQPFEGIGVKLKEKLKKRDEILSSKLMPQMIESRSKYFELQKNFTEKSPELNQAQYEYNNWQEKVDSRKLIVVKQASEILPLKGDRIDIQKLATVIEPATLPITPVRPHKIKAIVIAIVSGIALGFIIAIIMEFFDHSLKETKEIETYLSLSVMGRIPSIDT